MNGGHWAARAELGAAWGLRFTFAVHRRLGRWPFRLILLPVLAYFFLLKPAVRRSSLDYLGRMRAQGFLDAEAGLGLAWRHLWAYGEGLLDRLDAWDPQSPPPVAEFHGEVAVQAMLDRGQGFLLLSGHLGNLEAARVLGRGKRSRSIHVLVHTAHAQRYNDLLKDLDPGSQLNLLQVSDIGPQTAVWLQERVAAGDVVLIAADRVPLGGGGTVSAPFLGDKAPFPVGPYVLGSLLECPVVLFFCLGSAGRYQVHYELFAERLSLPRPGRDQALRELAGRFAARLQHYCSLAPLQWGNFYPFWRPAAEEREHP